MNASKEWNAVAVQRILSNRVYLGDTVQGVSEKVSFKSKKTRRLPKDKWVVTKATHQPIITVEEFEEVEKIRCGKRFKKEPHKGHLHIFKGLLSCGGCGSSMFARTRKNRPMAYICGSYAQKGKAQCSSHHVKEELLSGIVIEEIEGLLRNEEMRKRLAEGYRAETVSGEGRAKEIERLKQQLQIKQRQQDTLYLDRLEERISEELFDRTNKSLEKKIGTIKKDIEEAGCKNSLEEDPEEMIDEMLENFRNGGLTHEFVKLLVDKIIVYDDNDDISCLTDYCYGENNTEGLQQGRAVLLFFKFGKPT